VNISRRHIAFLLGAVGAGVVEIVQGKTEAAQSEQRPFTSPFAEVVNKAAKRADAWFPNYRFREGETLDRLRIHYATLGSPHRNAHGEIDNAVLVLHWTGSSGAALLSQAYTDALYGPGKPLDARRYYLIFADSIGCGQSSKPSDGLRARFPNYNYGDTVDLQHKLVTETLGLKHLHAVVGMSMGGMNAWQWAEAYPDFTNGVMPVVSLPTKVSGRNLIWRKLAIQSILSDPDYDDGNYTKPTRGWIQAYQLLRMMIDGVPHLQAIAPDSTGADNFIAAARAQALQGDANDVLYSLRASRDYDPEPALSTIKTKVFALNFSDDEFNPDVLKILETRISEVRNGRYFVQPGSSTSFGHLTMAHPELWANHGGDFIRWLGDGLPSTGSPT
jgi:homoserine O-acetyltransferase/O-succinyltransferase